jgi:hypothetical protein
LTRRNFIWTVMMPAAVSRSQALLSIPVHRITDGHGLFPPGTLENFWTNLWPETVRTFGRGGIALQTTDGPGEVRRTAGDRPNFIGLRRGVMNLVITDHIPMLWDNGRALAGVATLYGAYPVCMIALRYAHGNRMPFLAVNTCVHELLHAFMQDIFVARPSWYQSGGREARIDWYATRLWLFHDGAAIRQSAQSYLTRLRALSGLTSGTP